MRSLALLSAAFLLVLIMGVPSAASAGTPPIKDTPTISVPIPKGTEHIVIEAGDKDAKKVFTYFPYPTVPSGYPRHLMSYSGLYRLDVSPEGKVTGITILKTMGQLWDELNMKVLVKWKAKPGGLRAVDVPISLHGGYDPGPSYH